MPTKRGAEGQTRGSGELDAVLGLASKVEKALGQLPALLDEQIQEHPHRTLGVTLAAGVTLGVLAASRVSRMLASGVVAYALTEWLRTHPFEGFSFEAAPRAGNKGRPAEVS